MPDIKILGILSVECTTEPSRCIRGISEQKIEDMFYGNTANSNVNPVVNSKDKYKIDYFIAGPEKHVDMKVHAIITQAVHNEFQYLFASTGYFTGTVSLQVKDGANHSKHL